MKGKKKTGNSIKFRGNSFRKKKGRKKKKNKEGSGEEDNGERSDDEDFHAGESGPSFGWVKSYRG